MGSHSVREIGRELGLLKKTLCSSQLFYDNKRCIIQEVDELQNQLAPLKEQLASYQDLPPVSQLLLRQTDHYGMNDAVIMLYCLGRIWTWLE